MPTGRFHQDMSGTKIAMLTLLEKTDAKTKNGSYKYIVKCDCGNEKTIAYCQIISGKAKSCGCLQFRKGKDSPNFKHGRSGTKEYDLELHMKRNYGVNFSDYDKMLKKQNGGCAICKSPAPNHHKKRLNIDHCHITGRVRGLLCDACNRALGLFKDSPDIMLKAISYVSE